MRAHDLCRPCRAFGQGSTRAVIMMCGLVIMGTVIGTLLMPWNIKTTPIHDASANIAKRVFGQDFKLSPWNMKDSMRLGDMNSDKSPEIEQKATKPSPDTKPTLTGAKPNSATDSNVDGAKETVTGQEQKKQANVSVCPEKPKGLVGNIRTYLDPVSISAVEAKYREVTIGGNYRPQDCKPQQRLALIIPCRNRTQHLNILLNNLVGLLIKQKLDFTVFVIDQDLPTTFNRGMLFNVGYLEALKRGNYDCFIFHDVDMIPTNDNCLYRCTHNPRHFLSGVSKWNYGLPYSGYFGGVVAFTREQFKDINGDSNLYFGWGGEDDDLRTRIVHKGYTMLRYPKFVGRYDTISHKRDHGNKANPARFKLTQTTSIRQSVEGLSTTKYRVTEVVQAPLYTKIKVNINMTEIIKTAPPSDWPILKGLLKDAHAFDAEISKTKTKSLSQNQLKDKT